MKFPRCKFRLFFCAAVLAAAFSQISCNKKTPISVPPTSPAPAQTIPGRIFAPYFATWFPQNNFSQVAQESGIKYFTLAFVTSSANTCSPIWSNKQSIQEEVDIPAAIAALRKQGGDVIVSFGGAQGHELGRVCKDPASLQAAYQSVIHQYRLRMVDFDIETSAIRDPASVDRRNIALAALQAANAGLRLSFTLEVMPSGLTDESLNLLKNAMQHNVKIDAVNILAMDYGPPADPNLMGQNAIDAANHTLEQLKEIHLDTRLGITAMIGKNDVSPEVFTQNDAKTLFDFGQSNPSVGWLSMWSTARDHPCPTGAKIVTGTCSGIEQQAYDFSHTFEKFQ
ncbi:MAG TPA: chitinase [Terriglobales bacterium]